MSRVPPTALPPEDRARARDVADQHVRGEGRDERAADGQIVLDLPQVELVLDEASLDRICTLLERLGRTG